MKPPAPHFREGGFICQRFGVQLSMLAMFASSCAPAAGVSPGRPCALTKMQDTGPALSGRLRVVVGEVGREFAVGVGLGEQLLGLLLKGCDGVSTGGKAQRRLVQLG
jgi:hypothetical protein